MTHLIELATRLAPRSPIVRPALPLARRARASAALGAAITAALATGCSDATHPEPPMLALPGNAYYPESLSASADGTLFVGSLASGQVVAFDDGATESRTVVGAASGVTGIAGVVVHDDELFVCSIDTSFQRSTEVRSFGLDGTPHRGYTLGTGRFCNDMAFDTAGNLYVTDSFSGSVLRLAPGGTALEPWLTDASLAPAQQGAFGLDGIVATDGAVYLTKLDTGGLYRVAIGADGRAGAVTRIAVSPALTSPDGMRLVDARTLLVVENTGALLRVALSGDTASATTLIDSLDQPTSVIVARGWAWVSQGQLGRLFAQPPQSPDLPFSVVRVAL
jgi:sugar lactone lactonase YvrE